jgi:hypothetical protein
MNRATESRRWYQEPYVWLLISLPLSAVVAGFYTLYLAIISDDGLVADDYYKRGKEINRVLKRDEAATSLGLSAKTTFDFDHGRIVVNLKKKPDYPAPDQVNLRLLHATRAGYDQSLVLQRLPNGQYFGLYKKLVPGHWYLHLETDVWRLTGQLKIPNEKAVNLAPSLG